MCFMWYLMVETFETYLNTSLTYNYVNSFYSKLSKFNPLLSSGVCADPKIFQNYLQSVLLEFMVFY